jgi:hypothetical protein
MPAALPLKHPVKVGQLVRRRLRELKRTPRELAEAVQVSEDYIVELVAGRRRPPAPGRIDLYAPMARFLRLHRNDLPTCARVERSAEPAARRRPDPAVWKLLFELCEPRKARLLARQLAKPEGGALEHLIVGRLLEVAQGFVARRLEDEVGMRVAATREGRSYLDMRMRLLEFLDSSPDTITVADCEDFVRNRIVFWDLDLETRAMRIVLR